MSLELPVLGTLPESWEVVPFGEVLDGGTRNGIYKKKEFHGRGARIVNMGELFGHPRLFDVEMKRVELTEKEIAKAGLEAGDLLFARRSLVAEGAGKCSLVCEVNEPTTFESSIIRARPDASKVDSHFLYYMFSSPFGKYILGTIRRTVAVSGITGTDLVTLEIPVPPLPEQRAIASILGALDDKIELNRRMNATLESLARAIFKSWFVDFDPVHVNAGKINAGQMPASSAIPTTQDPKVLDLFPSTFQDSELGPIPEGWSAMPISEAVKINPRRTLPKGTIAKYLDMKNVPTRGHRPDEIIDREMKSGTKFINGDTLMARITPCLENGKTAFVDFLPDGEVGWGSTEFIVLRPRPPLPNEYGYFLARDPDVRQHAIKNMTGTSGRQRVAKECFDSYLIPVPTEGVANEFAKVIEPLMSSIKTASEEGARLSDARDALLPKLLSGELPVPLEVA
ncbi:restriction endonuclease subunit S [Rhodopirellula europaea]|uniref:Restriction modification system DNA specificity subunit n=1 Tax=Rhodopirellula europaea SH398 TaxID=1263868 RepID=M5SAA0_9BACT|nr:restriction endonuclease subunit S [Rhodopirellula europaea]EMI24592.1 restriction modification system DNA specificity subunit [Rhodopirellula europaea SH398]